MKTKSSGRFNVLSIIKISWNKARELVLRAYNPKVADELLKDLITKKNYPRHFDYRMEKDEQI